MEILRVFSRLLNEGYAVHLTIVSSLGFNDYVTKTTSEDVTTAVGLMQSMKNNVTYHHEVPEEKVGDILRNAHVGLLPTYDDTFGYSVLECQAAGAPVISTNVCAIPEINNDTLGWLISLPLNAEKRVAFTTAEERSRLSRIIEEKLYATIRSILANPAEVEHKAKLAWERIRDHYAPEQRAAFLTNVYREVLSTIRNPKRS
jgi:glycosyltransferase involved in cell wall biosynthesis